MPGSRRRECTFEVTESAVRHHTQYAFSPILPITPIIPMFAFSQTIFL